MTRLVQNLRSNTIALLALFFALSSSAFAAGNLITGDQIAPETLTGAHIQDGSVQGSELRYGSVGRYHLEANAVTGGLVDTAR